MSETKLELFSIDEHERQSAGPSRQLPRIGERTCAALRLALHRRVLVQLADRAPVEVLAVDVAVVEESRERAQRPRQRLRLRGRTGTGVS